MNLNTIPLLAIDLETIKIKPGNRDSLDKAKLQELADSMKQHGLVQPILVQADPKEADIYHLVAGERRVKAAELIGWETIPGRVITGKIADEELKELRLVENLQRVDLTPWEEAAQLSDLRALHPDDRIEDLADRLGKSPTWAAQRLAIGKLCPELRTMVQEQDWPLGHIVELARLPANIQESMVEVFDKEAEADYNDEWSEVTEKGSKRKAPSLSTLRDLLESCQYLLSSAPWKLDDAKMLPEAGSCKECPKRLLAQRLLFPEVKDVKKDRCLDAGCWDRKKAAMVELELGKLRAKKVEPIFVKSNYLELHPAIKEKLGDAKPLHDHEVTECKKTDKGAKVALIVSDEDFCKVAYVKERPKHTETMPSRREVDQTTGKVKPKSDKERLQEFTNKRLCAAVEFWRIGGLNEARPSLDQLLPMVILFGTDGRQSFRSDAHWHELEAIKKTDKASVAPLLWTEMIPVFSNRLKRSGPMDLEALPLWTEAVHQVCALNAHEQFSRCWQSALQGVKFPKSMEKAGLTDPHAGGAIPNPEVKAKKVKGAA